MCIMCIYLQPYHITPPFPSLEPEQEPEPESDAPIRSPIMDKKKRSELPSIKRPPHAPPTPPLLSGSPPPQPINNR